MSTTTAKKMTLREAAEQWVETTLAMEGLKRLRDEAAAVLLAPVERADKPRAFFGMIVAKRTGGTLVLDQAAVKDEFPPERLVEGDLMRRSKRGWTLERMK